MPLSWKPNWQETQQHLIDWWNHQGPVIGAWPAPAGRASHEEPGAVSSGGDIVRFYSDPAYHAGCEPARLARSFFGGDILPVAETDIGPGSLALYLGSEPGLTKDTVWFNACLEHIGQPISFDPNNRWWQVTEQTLRACAARSAGKYLVGCPDLVEGLDILASLVGTEALMIHLVEEPRAVMARLEEITEAWFAVYSRVYDLIRLEDGSSTFGAFRIWGPGKTAKLQCDASAMLSPRMFRKFAVPFLKRQCAWLDHSLYHLDGHQCLCHLDALLEIEDLQAIEWTPDPTVPPGGDPAWYPLYRKILAAGKSVQVVGVKPRQIRPLLDAVGRKGVYLFVDAGRQEEFESLEIPTYS